MTECLTGLPRPLLENTPEAISKRIITTVKSLEIEHNEVAILNIVARGNDLKEKDKSLNNILVDECKRKKIAISKHLNINPQRHLRRIRVHFNFYGISIFVKNIGKFINYLSVCN